MNFNNLLISSYNDYYKKKLLFNVFIIFTLVMILYNKFSLTFLATFAFALFIIDTYISYETQIEQTTNESIMEKLSTITETLSSTRLSYSKNLKNNTENKKNITSNLYIDATMINFLHEILWLYKYNPQLFFTFVNGIDNILKFRIEIEEYYESEKKLPSNIKEIVYSCEKLKFKTIENLKSFEFVIPTDPELLRILNDIILEYHKLINKNLYYIKINIDKNDLYPLDYKPYNW